MWEWKPLALTGSELGEGEEIGGETKQGISPVTFWRWQTKSEQGVEDWVVEKKKGKDGGEGKDCRLKVTVTLGIFLPLLKRTYWKFLGSKRVVASLLEDHWRSNWKVSRIPFREMAGVRFLLIRSWSVCLLLFGCLLCDPVLSFVSINVSC